MAQSMKDVKAITIPECIVANTSQTFSSTTNTSSYAWFNYYPTSTSALGLCKAIRIKGKFHVYGNSYSWLGVWYNSDAQGGESQVTLNTGSGWVETPFDITCYLIRDDWINNTLWNVFAFGGGSSNYRWIRAVVAKTNNNNLDFYTQSDTTNEYFRVTVDSIEIGVSKITNDNGNIIWGSQSAFPYRRLEYIHFSGAEYIIENFNLSTKNRRMILDYTADTWTNNTTLLGQYDNNSVADNTKRLYIVRQATTNGNQLAHCVGNTWIGATNASVNTRYLSTIAFTNASNNTLQVNIKNVDTGQTLTNTSGTGTGKSIQNFGAIGTLGACVNKMTNNTYTRNGFWTGKLYKFEKYVNSTGVLQNNQFPAQRKSDGVCGLYDTAGGMFFPMTGTTITAAAAGPVVDEYWDLTAPD